MKIYNVQILQDMNNTYNGLDDTMIYTFASLEEAEYKLDEEYENAKNMLAKHIAKEELETEKEELGFYVSNGSDYIHGRIIEDKLNLDIFAITQVKTDTYEAASVSTDFVSSKEEAYIKYDEIKNELFNEKLEEFDAEEDGISSNEKLDEFICNNVHHDYQFTNGNKYFHVVHDGGQELIISAERLTFGDNK